MEPIKYDAADLQRLEHIENQIARRLVEWRGNTAAELVIYALMRCARRLIHLHPPSKQEELLLVVVPFLRGDDAPGSKFLM